MPNLKVSDLRPFIPAKDFVISKHFYASLGWKVKDVEDGLALVQLADQHFYIQNYYVKEVAENCMLHLTVEDAQAWYQHVSSVLQNERFPEARVQPPKQQPYGAIVTFLHDPTGVLLHPLSVATVEQQAPDRASDLAAHRCGGASEVPRAHARSRHGPHQSTNLAGCAGASRSLRRAELPAFQYGHLVRQLIDL